MSLYHFSPPSLLIQPLCFSLCLPLPPPPPAPRRCADVQRGAMAAEEVTCGIFSGVVFADARSSLLFPPRLREGKGLLVVAPLFASHLCCDWNHINFDAVSLFAPHPPPPCRAYDHCWVGLSLSILFLLVIWKRNLAADLFYYFYYYFFAFASILSQCSTNVVYKQQLMHLLFFFFF